MDFLKLLYVLYVNYEKGKYLSQDVLNYTEFREKLSQLLIQADQKEIDANHE